MNGGAANTDSFVRRFRKWFWRPPRAHGEIIEDRTVTFLELFYDLVYVVVIAQAAHHLAGHVSLEGFVDFAIVFGLIWIAWLNGSLYHELHGLQDGRTRSFVFVQMAILALLAVFTGDAAGSTGVEFALVYVAYLAVLTWLWYSVRRRDSEEYMGVTGRYIVGMLVTIAAVLLSTVLPADLRVATWGLIVIGWIAFMLVANTVRSEERTQAGLVVTESMVERFGLFIIIVLGEVVVGVVEGMSETIHHENGYDIATFTTGLLALIVGFGLWWVFFDFVGRRMPRTEPQPRVRWMTGHLPIALGIAAAGAAMVGLIEHAHDAHTPPETAWLLAGAVAIVLVGVMLTTQSLKDWERQATVYRPLMVVLGAGVAAALLVGWWQPAPWLLALSLSLILSAVWSFAIFRWLKSGYGKDSALPN